jgi:hypothetical protein
MASQVVPPRDGFRIETIARQFTRYIMGMFRRHIKKTQKTRNAEKGNIRDPMQPPNRSLAGSYL